MIATARIVMPRPWCACRPGATGMSREAQALCFMAGANSIFYGEKLLTTANNDAVRDREMIAALGLEVAQPG